MFVSPQQNTLYKFPQKKHNLPETNPPSSWGGIIQNPRHRSTGHFSDLGVVALVILRDRLALQIADERPLLEHLVGVPGLGGDARWPLGGRGFRRWLTYQLVANIWLIYG